MPQGHSRAPGVNGYQQFIPTNIPNAARTGVSSTPCGPTCPNCDLIASCGSPDLGGDVSPIIAISVWISGCIASGKLSHRDSCNPGVPLCPLALSQD
jgi:hypothetical protein